MTSARSATASTSSLHGLPSEQPDLTMVSRATAYRGRPDLGRCGRGRRCGIVLVHLRRLDGVAHAGSRQLFVGAAARVERAAMRTPLAQARSQRCRSVAQPKSRTARARQADGDGGRGLAERPHAQVEAAARGVVVACWGARPNAERGRTGAGFGIRPGCARRCSTRLLFATSRHRPGRALARVGAADQRGWSLFRPARWAHDFFFSARCSAACACAADVLVAVHVPHRVRRRPSSQ